MTTLKKSSANATSIDCLVIGTEFGLIYCVDSQAFVVIAKCSVSGVPSFLYATGKFFFLFNKVYYKLLYESNNLFILPLSVRTILATNGVSIISNVVRKRRIASIISSLANSTDC